MLEISARSKDETVVKVDRARLRGPEATPNEARSWWLHEALAADVGAPCPPLAGRVRADLAIVGGGYTGLWTAFHLKQADPGADVVLLEADICGGGPSGRNGGFMYGLWDDYAVLADLFGDEEAARVGHASENAVDLAAGLFRRSNIDIWFERAGHLIVSTSPAFDHALDEYRKPQSRGGFPTDFYQLLSASEVAERCRSPHFRGGVLQPRGATVQPARLARGLRSLILDAGVRIYEGTAVQRIQGGSPVQIVTGTGEVSADQVVLGLNAWSNQLPGFRRSIIPRASHIVLTEPAPERLQEMGWTGGEGIGDFRQTLSYLRTTPDGRIAFGGATATPGRGVDGRMSRDASWYRRLEARLQRWFPEFRGVKIDSMWGGPIDVSAHHIPFFGSMWGGNVHFGMGFTGGGVGPCVLAGQILSSLVLGRQDEFTSLPLVGFRSKRFPPQPLLHVGGRIALEAILRTDDAWEAGRSGNRLLKMLARLPRRMGYNLGL
jgi:glycine/D-amino acid oxidase-like deaminating enzyme